MPSFNSVQIIGNLTRDPECKFTPKGTAVAELGLAINRVWKDDQGQKREEVLFCDVELWGRQAEVAGEYLKKGSPVFIQGRLTMDQWEDKATGQKRTKLKVTGEQMQLLGGKQDGKASDGF
jgi:single-strand DNA-binding protein